MVEDLDHFEVGVVRERQHHVARPEPRVHAAVHELGAEQGADAFGRRDQAIGSGGEGQVVETHEVIVDRYLLALAGGVAMS